MKKVCYCYYYYNLEENCLNYVFFFAAGVLTFQSLTVTIRHALQSDVCPTKLVLFIELAFTHQCKLLVKNLHMCLCIY